MWNYKNFDFTYRGTTYPAANIVVTMKGTNPQEENSIFYVTGAHYDSISSQSCSQGCPGADDNGSGVASLIEMINVFYKYPPLDTIYFVFYAAEELGLYGSRAHAQSLEQDGISEYLFLALIMDMVAFEDEPGSFSVVLEPKIDYFYLVELLSEAAEYTELEVETSFDPFGSDHMPYLDRGMPALLTIESDWDDYPHYHRPTDVPQNLNPKYAIEIVKLNVAALAISMGGYFDPDAASTLSSPIFDIYTALF